MTVDALEYLRTEDPAPHGSTAPPMEQVLAFIERTEAEPRPRRDQRQRRRPGFSLVPALAVAATLAIVGVVVVLAVTHRSQSPSHMPPASRTAPTPQTVPSPQSLMPRGGMPGQLTISGVASPSAGGLLIFFDQCEPCHGSGAGSIRTWQAATTDGGASWHAAPTPLRLTTFAFSGRDGWAEGTGPGRAVHFYDSHDGGGSWHIASSASPAPGGVGDVSMAGGEVWTLGVGCAGAKCTDTILRAPVAGDHLAATPAQPPLHGNTNVSVVAMSRDTAYVLPDGVGSSYGPPMYATHDGGRTWQAGATPCPRSFGRLYRGGSALWVLCTPTHGAILVRRSTDGGDHWTTTSAKFGGGLIQPASEQVAWAVGAGGTVVRTSDGGQSWSQVWSAGRPEPGVLAGSQPAGLNRSYTVLLTVQSPTTAMVIAQVSRGHVGGQVGGHPAQTDFVTYRTTDGGRSWRPGAVRLPAG